MKDKLVIIEKSKDDGVVYYVGWLHAESDDFYHITNSSKAWDLGRGINKKSVISIREVKGEEIPHVQHFKEINK